jgi:hypothetical protein
MSCNSQSPFAAHVRQSSGWSEMKLHHALAELLETVRLRMDNQTFHGRRRAGCRRSGAAFHFNEAHAA